MLSFSPSYKLTLKKRTVPSLWLTCMWLTRSLQEPVFRNDGRIWADQRSGNATVDGCSASHLVPFDLVNATSVKFCNLRGKRCPYSERNINDTATRPRKCRPASSTSPATSVNKMYEQLVVSFLQISTLNHSFHCHLLAIHRTIYTRARRTGTSIRGPTVDARAWSLSGPNVATATAIASSKLLLAAVKLWVLDSRYPKPRRWHTMSVKKKMMTK